MELTKDQIELKERRELIDEIKSLGKNYKFYKYTTRQLVHIRDNVRKMIAREEAEYMQIAKQYYKEKEIGIPNYIEQDGIFYVWNEADLEYQPLESDYDFDNTLTEVSKTYYEKPKVYTKSFSSTIMDRFTKVL